VPSIARTGQGRKLLKAYEFPEWKPDLADNVLTVAKNVRAIANGYAPKTYSRADIANIWSAVDPRNSQMLWAMPNGLILAYNWVLQRWSVYDVPVTGMFTGLTAAVSIDALDAIYTDLDHVTVSLDDPSLAGGNPILLLVDSSNVIGALTGTNLEASIKQSNVELTPGKRSRVRSIRPVTDATTATSTLSAKMKAGDAEDLVTCATMRGNGKMPVRANGRFLDVTVGVPAGEVWSYITGCEYEFEPGDGR
jgi:hypothetical protein